MANIPSVANHQPPGALARPLEPQPSSAHSSISIDDRWACAFVGLLEGVAFWAAYHGWPHSSDRKAFALAALAGLGVASLLVQFSCSGANWRRLALSVGSIAPVYSASAWWACSRHGAPGAYTDAPGSLLVSWLPAAFVSLYVLAPFCQLYQRSGTREISYEDLFRLSWNNFFVGLVGTAFVVVLWLLVTMSAALFTLTGLLGAEALVAEPGFYFPVYSSAFGVGIAIGRRGDSQITAARGFVLTAFRFLAPLLSTICLVFGALLLFRGIETLARSTSAAATLITLIVALVIFVNAIFEDGSQAPSYQRPIRRLIESSIVTSPAFALLSCYCVWLRVAQYGLSVQRFELALAALLATLFSFAYAAAVLRPSSEWLTPLRDINPRLAVVIVAIPLAVNSPILDPEEWSARHQVYRLRSGAVDAVDFDYFALRFDLGAAGYAKLAELEAMTEHPQYQTISKRAAAARAASRRPPGDCRSGRAYCDS